MLLNLLIFGKKTYFKNYFYLVGIVFANMLDRSHRCYCPKLSTRYEPSTGCLNGTRWVIQECNFPLDNSCFYTTMWREECGWVWSSWSKCSKQLGQWESTRQRVCKSGDIWGCQESVPKFEIRKCDPMTTDWDSTLDLTKTPIWSEWTEWSECEADLRWTDVLDIKKSDIKNSNKCVAGTMRRERFCLAKDWDDHRICNYFYVNKTRLMTIRTVHKNLSLATPAEKHHDTEIKLCHYLDCKWGVCNPDGKRSRKNDCASLCKSVCDPKISICDIESVDCDWWLAIGNYILYTAVFCYSFILFLVCFCTYRRKNLSQRKAYREIPAEKAKIAEIEDSCSSDSPSESSESEPLTKNDTEHSTLLKINEIE